MPHPKQHIPDLAKICQKKGITHAVISPGSRSAPLIQAFYETLGDGCVSMVDERSAAFFALGIATYTRQPVVLICTSGTAVLNYAPAIAEAYYQQVPLLAVTADRPREWIDQQDNQTLWQYDIYKNFIKGSYDLPQVITSDDDLWFAHRMINEAIDLCNKPGKGPVHINVPLTEPLYGELPAPSENVRIIERTEPEVLLNLPDELTEEWKNARSIMIIHGQDHPDSEVSGLLPLFSNDGRIIVLAENISNVHGPHVLRNSNIVLSSNRDNNPEYPDLILHSGGQVVSKALTGYLRRASHLKCWRIGNDSVTVDTFKLATRTISYPAAAVYRSLSRLASVSKSSAYAHTWLTAAARSDKATGDTIQKMAFCDAQLFKYIAGSIPDGTLVVYGNSSIIRYSQLFASGEKSGYYSNRGVSGIDGCLSSAAGVAFASKKPTLAILGDLGFLYDSNALWNRNLPDNLKILVINNSGGGIFHILKGPSEHPGFKKFIEANHPVNIPKLAEAYGLNYMFADDLSSLESKWSDFLKSQGRSVVFEVKTDAEISASVFRQIMGGSR